ncbi:basic proline-rich protein-like [Canis lupus dingo]|uniref:basic proline-rich protein-like n=1 Tax=Canis lupus dingo TaxID=286419 RepID=UPI0020C3BBFE|nr:basic proline-rich protein-like [Canis lupus dingo]
MAALALGPAPPPLARRPPAPPPPPPAPPRSASESWAAGRRHPAHPPEPQRPRPGTCPAVELGRRWQRERPAAPPAPAPAPAHRLPHPGSPPPPDFPTGASEEGPSRPKLSFLAAHAASSPRAPLGVPRFSLVPLNTHECELLRQNCVYTHPRGPSSRRTWRHPGSAKRWAGLPAPAPCPPATGLVPIWPTLSTGAPGPAGRVQATGPLPTSTAPVAISGDQVLARADTPSWPPPSAEEQPSRRKGTPEGLLTSTPLWSCLALATKPRGGRVPGQHAQRLPQPAPGN